MNARMLRFADGPDAVHRRVIGRAELRKFKVTLPPGCPRS